MFFSILSQVSQTPPNGTTSWAEAGTLGLIVLTLLAGISTLYFSNQKERKECRDESKLERDEWRKTIESHQVERREWREEAKQERAEWRTAVEQSNGRVIETLKDFTRKINDQ